MAYRRPFGTPGAPTPPGMGSQYGQYGAPGGHPAAGYGDDNGKNKAGGMGAVASPVVGSASPPASGYHSRPSSFDASGSGPAAGQPADDSKNKPAGRSRRSSMDARKQTKEWVRRNYSNLLLYFGLIVGVFFFYHLMSDGDFSFLL